MRERGACCGGIDSTTSRLLHAANRPAAGSVTAAPNRTDTLTAEEQGIVDSAERYLADGLALLRWWETAERGAGFTERFELQRAFNRAATSYGFFGSIDRDGRTLPLMGNVQE